MTLPVFLHIEATPNPNEQSALQSYLQRVPAILQRHGGVPVASYDVEQAWDKLPCPAAIAVVSFPHRDAIQAFFADPDYQALVPLRETGFYQVRFFQTSERI